MKVLLIKDVYKLGRAGDVKRVADGYGRNFLIPQGLAVLATPGALKQTEHIRANAAAKRTLLNSEMSSVADLLKDTVLTFSSKAGETGKLYGSITAQMIADTINEKNGTNIDRHQVDVQPIRVLGEHKARIRLTVDLIPEIKILVHREGEATEQAEAKAEPKAEATSEESPEVKVETKSETISETETATEEPAA
jgi:large subunit ribosomal protein L9